MGMKKIIRIAIQTLVAFAALGCVKENAFETIPGDSIIREFTASFDGASTKTALGSGNAVLWEAGDRIDYMYSTSNGVQSMTVEKGGPAVKIWVEMEESDTWFTAVYGASTVAKGPVEGVFTVSGVVPSAQDGLFPSSHVSVAHLSGKELDSKELKFRNLTSLIKFSLTREDVAAVVFTANGGESISFGASGLASIGFDGSGNPKASSIGETSSEVTIDINGAGTYYISILPQTLEAGFTLKCYDGAGGDLGEVRYDRPLEISRSSIVTLGELESLIDKEDPAGGTESGFYLGIIGFNTGLDTYPIQYLSADSSSGYYSFIDGLTTKNGTLLYYAVDKSIDNLQAARFPDDLHDVAIVTFTDGLDRGSLDISDAYLTNADYLLALNARLIGETVSGQRITSWSIGVRGDDVTNYATFQNNLKNLATSSENVYELADMSQVNGAFSEIADILGEPKYLQRFVFNVYGLSHGERCRFTFDDISNYSSSAQYIEGTFNRLNRTLENVRYVGLTSTSGSVVSGILNADNSYTYAFEGIQAIDGGIVSGDYVQYWFTEDGMWGRDAGFIFDPATIGIERVKRSTAIMLNIDCSSSLNGEGLGTLKNDARSFMERLCEKQADQFDVSSVSLDQTEASMAVGSSIRLRATVSPATALRKSVEWSSTAPTVASVDEKGEVTAHSPGFATITVRTVDGSYTATCHISVLMPVKEIRLSGETSVLAEGESVMLAAEVLPQNATNKQLVWRSSDGGIASVSQDGLVRAVSPGTVTISATAQDGYGAVGTSEITVDFSFHETAAGLNMKMVYVKGGDFRMGIAGSTNSVFRILDSFYIGECEITQSEWEKVMGTSIQQHYGKEITTCVDPDYPMYYVSWYDAKAFCDELSRQTGRTYCLPTEAQWEYAARGGRNDDGTTYSGSNSLDEVAWYRGNHIGSGCYYVKTRKPNGLGLYDMSGNVDEWCSDWYDYNYYYTNDTVNPTGPPEGTSKVKRGGSWDDGSPYQTVHYRGYAEPNYFGRYTGFRVVIFPE